MGWDTEIHLTPRQNSMSAFTHAPKEMPPLEAEAALRDTSLVERSLKSGWLDRAHEKLRRIRGADAVPAIWEEARDVIVAANEGLELALFDLRDADLYTLETKRDSSYYSKPIMAAWKESDALDSPLLLPPLQDLLGNDLKLGSPKELIHPRTEKDIQKIGTQHDFFAMLFWAEIQSIFQRQKPWSAADRFNDLASLQSGDWGRQLLAIGKAAGQDIHALSAKDTSGRWAYYLVYVAPAREEAFRRSIEGGETIDLEDFGFVVASEYQFNFRDRQFRRAKEKIKPLVDDYVRLAQRRREYSYGSVAKTIAESGDIFKAKRFDAAAANEGSRQALADQLADLVAKSGVLSSDESSSEDEAAPVEVRLTQAAARTVVDVVRERGLGLRSLPRIFKLLTKPTKSDVEDVLEVVRNAVKAFGNTDSPFDALYLITSQHRGLDHPLIAEAVRDIVADSPAHAAEKLHQEMASLEIIARRTEIQSRYLFEYLNCFFGNGAEGERREAFRVITDFFIEASVRSAEEKQNFIDFGSIEQAGVRLKHNISRRLAQVVFDRDNSSVWNKGYRFFLLSDVFFKELEYLSLLGIHIESLPHKEKCDLLRDLITPSLEEACNVADYPVALREGLLRQLIYTLLSHDQAVHGPWSSKIVDERIVEPPASVHLRASIPKTAPAVWKEDKTILDTPPDFIKRHYGPLLRADATGLTRADIRQLDPTLYMALGNWLRKNALPADCPLPQLSDRVTAELEETSIANIRRLASAHARRSQKDRS